MSFATRVLASCQHVATKIFRAAVIILLVCVALPLVIGWWCLYVAVMAHAAISVAIWGPPTLFRYEEEENAHDHDNHKPDGNPEHT